MWQAPRRLPESAAATTNQYALPHQLVSFHSSSTTSCTPAPIHHPGFHNPANAACAYYHDGSDTPAITQWSRPDGTQMTAAAATAKSPSDAAATATVVDATTVATTSDLRRPWRPHLPPVSQQVVESRLPHSCGQGHHPRRAPSLQDCHN